MMQCLRFKISELGDICDEDGLVGGDQNCKEFWNDDRLYRAFRTGGPERICGGKDLDVNRKNIWDNCTSFPANECPEDSGCANVDPYNLGGLLLVKEFVHRNVP